MSANKFEHLSLLTEMIKSSLVHDMHPIIYFENHFALPLWQHHPTPLSQAALPFSRDLQARLVSRVGHQYPEVKYRSAFSFRHCLPTCLSCSSRVYKGPGCPSRHVQCA